MSSKIDDRTLDALGLAGCAISEGEPVPDIEGEVEEGLVKEAVVLTLAACLDCGFTMADEDGPEQPVEFIEIDVRDVSETGIGVARAEPNPRILRLHSTSGTDLQITCAWGETDPDLCRTDPDDPGTVYIELAGKGPYAVMQPTGSGVVLIDGMDGPMLHTAYTDFADIPPLAGMGAPIAQWCSDCDDTWLAATVQGRAASRDPWNDAVAVGMYHRLYEYSSADIAQKDVEALLAKRVPDRDAPPLRWLLGVSDEQLRILEDLALAEVDQVHARIAEIAREVSPDSEPWRVDLLDLLHRRDDLEGVRQLLAERGRAARINAALTELDAVGSRFVSTTADVEPFDDERLNRAWLRDADAWWAFVPQAITA